VPAYRRWVAGHLVSVIGTWSQDLALTWYLLDRTGSPSITGAVIAAEWLPVLLLSAHAGAVVDHWDTLKLARRAQVAFGIIAAVLTVAVLRNAPIALILGLCTLRGIGNALDSPARAALIGEMVPRALLPSAVTLSSVVFNAGRIIGPAIAGVVLGIWSPSACIAVNAASFIVLYALLRSIEPGADRPPAPDKRPKVREGLRYLWSRSELRAGFVASAIVGTFALNSSTLFPLMAKEGLSGSASTAAAIMTAAGIGAVVAGSFLTRRTVVSLRVLVVSSSIFAVVIALMAATTNAVTALFVAAAWGAVNITFASSARSLIQLHTDPPYRGRMMALFGICITGSTAVGAPMIGAITDLTSIRTTMLVVSAATLASGGLASIVARVRP